MNKQGLYEIVDRILALPTPKLQSEAIDALEQAYGPLIRSSLSRSKKQSENQLYLSNPHQWVTDKLKEFSWSKQVEMYNSVRDHKRSAFYACHRVSKTNSMARIAAWWIDTHDPGTALVITTSHSSLQVKAALWREIGRIHANAKLPGRVNLQEWYYPITNSNGSIREEIVAFGRKPADNDPTGFHGTYNKFVLVLGDEACYLPDVLVDGLDTLVSNEYSKIVLWGNPDDPGTRFAKICKPGSGWDVIRFGYQDTPNFTDEDVPQDVKDNLISPSWVEQKAHDWGEDSPMYQSKVLGLFPDNAEDSLIKMTWIKSAQERSLSKSLPIRLGCDVGGGSDKNVFCLSAGPVARIIHKDQNPDTIKTLNNGLKHLQLTNASVLNMDHIGIGWGAVNRANEIATDEHERRSRPLRSKLASKVHGIKVSQRAKDDKSFANLRSERYWKLREEFENGLIDIDPNDDILAGQLSAIKYSDKNGRIQVQSKSELSKSPDELDALVLSRIDPFNDLAEDKGKEKEKKSPMVLSS